MPPDYVARPRLQSPFGRSSPHTITLVSAAAGFGKSTLVSSWLVEGDCPVAWVSLDDSDNDLRAFVRCVHGAVEMQFPIAMPRTGGLLGAEILPPLAVVASTLIDELDEMDVPFVMVLDDIHRIDARPVLDLLAAIVEYPPVTLHLVLIGRRDPFLPIAKLRARGQLNEVRAEDLRFSTDETAAFLRNVFGDEGDAASVAALTDETEGWVTGLRLAAIARQRLQARDVHASRARVGRQHMLEYLLQEVLENEPPPSKAALLSSAVVDRFCASLCDALQESGDVTGSSRMNGEAFVAWLEQARLFLIPLDEERRWYRFHHLFQELLLAEAKRRLGPEAVAGLHTRASAWFESEHLVDEALKHALAAGNVERAASIVERNLKPAMNADQWYSVERWLDLLPEAAAETRPELLLARVWRLYYRFEIADIPPLVDRIDALLSGDPAPHHLTGDVEYFRGLSLFLGGDGVGALKHFEYALDQISMNDCALRGETEMVFGLAAQMSGETERGYRALREWLGDRPAPHPMRRTRLRLALVFMPIIAGDLAMAEQRIPQVREAATASGSANAHAWCDHLQGLIHLLRNEMDSAIEHFREAVDRRYVHHGRAAIDAMAGLILANQATGQQQAVSTTLQILREFVGSLGQPVSLLLAGSFEARFSILQGRPEAAVRWLETSTPPVEPTLLWWLAIPCLTGCRTLLAEGSAASLREAQERLRAYEKFNEGCRNTLQLITIRALQAIACEKQGNAEAAHDAIERALTLARPGKIIYPFLELSAPMASLLRRHLAAKTDNVEFIRQILAAFDGHAAHARAAGASGTRDQPEVDFLTAREIEVLVLLAQNLYQKEIAAKLSVSAETVKTHVKHIYQKLGVGGRRHAVKEALARSLVARP
jgi:LuxR family maltose regulon positive regulatory protein